MTPSLILIYNICDGDHVNMSWYCRELGLPYPKTPDEWHVLATEAANTPLPPSQTVLRDIDACTQARVWVLDKTAQEAWDQCDRSDWMVFLLSATLPEDRIRTLVQALVDRLVEKYITTYPEDTRVPEYTKERTPENARALHRLYSGQHASTPGDRELGVLAKQYRAERVCICDGASPEDIRAVCPEVPTGT